MTFEKYNESLSYSYVFGAFGTIELLTRKADKCKALLVDTSFVKNEAYAKIVSLCKEHNISLVVDEKIISKVRDKGNIFVIGVFDKYSSKLTNNNHLVLKDIDDKGLIGTIIRSMNGFKFNDLILINCNIDLFDEHLIRSTMGSFFACNIKFYNDLSSYINDYKGKHFYNISNKGNYKLSDINEKENISLIFSESIIDNENVSNIEFSKDISLDRRR